MAEKKQTKQPELIQEEKKKPKHEERKLCNGCPFFAYNATERKPYCSKGETVLSVVFNGRPFFLCKDKICKELTKGKK